MAKIPVSQTIIEDRCNESLVWRGTRYDLWWYGQPPCICGWPDDGDE